jgi:serine/threonine-protein kinase
MPQQKYEIIERIGTGGMAEVFMASSTNVKGFQKLVAIKRVLPSLTKDERFVRMFLDEAKVSLPLNHTNIVQTFDLGLADETYFIVMEYVDGRNLKEIIQNLAERGKRLSAGEAAWVGLEVSKGLAHAHSKRNADGDPLNIVHRDISPPNILISRDGEVKITDFGLAKAKSQAEATDPGVVKGKFGYLSPEAAEGEDVDGRTDIFAVGIVLWEMMAGRRLFRGEDDRETLELVKQAEVPALASCGRDVPQEFESIIRKALARRPDDRFESARDFGEALNDFLFSTGRAVSEFEIGDRVRQAIGETSERRSDSLGPSDMAVQREINQFVSLEDMEDLDLLLAEQEIEGSEVTPMPVEGDFEDPRQWSDMGFGSEDEAPDPEAMRQMMEGQDGDWEKQDLGKLGRLMAKGSNPGKKVGQNRDADASDDTDEPNETKTAEQDAGGSAVLVAVLVIAVLGIVAFGVVWLLGVSV